MDAGQFGEREDAAERVGEGRADGQDHAPTHVLKTGEEVVQVEAR